METRPPSRHSQDDGNDVVHAFARANAAALSSLYREEIAGEYWVRAVKSKSTLALVSASPFAEFNRVVNLGVFEPATRGQVDELVALYGRANVPFTVHLSPVAQPAEVGEWLNERGLIAAEQWKVLSRSVATPIDDAAGVTVMRIGRQEASTYARVYESAFGIPFQQGKLAASAIGQPGWHHYLAHDERRAIAMAAMFVHEHTAIFAGSGTLRAEVGRGAQTGLIARRLRDAAALGCEVALVETYQGVGDDRPEALRNIMRAGFSVAFLQQSFVYERGSRRRLV